MPFGGGGIVHNPAPGWERLAEGPVDTPMHGPAANDDWRLIDRRRDRVTLALEFSENLPVRRIERTIALAADRPRVEIGIRIEARRQGLVPAAFHPILRLPHLPGGLQVDANFDLGFTYPGVFDPDRMACEPGRNFDSLADVPKRRGGRIDLRHLPLGPPTEDVVLMAGIRGPVRARFKEEGFSLDVHWSRDLLPHCMMWVHDRGADGKPWGGRYRGLGIEPVAAAFDGPWSLSAGPNPLNAVGFSTALRIGLEAATQLCCTLAVSE